MTSIVARDPIKQELFKVAEANYNRAVDEAAGKYPSPKLVRLRLLRDTSPNWDLPKPRVFYEPGVFDYNQERNPINSTIWVSFANKYLGGGYLGRGYVQEEILTVEFYEMAMLIFKHKHPPMEINEAHIFMNLIRSSISDPEAYADYKKASLSYPPKIVSANFLAIDAPKRGDRKAPYTRAEVKHLAIKSFIGFLACVKYNFTKVNTGNWGAGVFYNRRDVVYYIQILSAWVTGIESLTFWMHQDSGVEKVMAAYNEAETSMDFLELGGRAVGFDLGLMRDIYEQ